MPALLVSPYAANAVFKELLDHTSLLKYLIDKWSLGPLGERIYRIKLKLPSGFSPQVPQRVNFECSGGTYWATYRSEGSSVTAERDLTFRKDNLPAQLRDEYAGFRERVLEDAERVISARAAD